MSGLAITLNNALSGLNVSQQALSVLSQNIANANTAGYSRQIINQSAVYLDGQGQGVNIDDITRKVDSYLLKAVQQQQASVSKTDVINDYHTRIQLLMGQPGSQNSIDSYINTFFNNVQSLSQTPQNTTLQQGVVNSGVTLATQIQSLSSSLRDLQMQADRDIKAATDAVNVNLANLSQVNIAISNNTVLGKSVADLQDKRDLLLNDISRYLNIQTFTNDSGSINVTAGNGVSLLDDTDYRINYSAAAAPDVFTNGSSLSAMTVSRIDANGDAVGTPTVLVSGGTPSEVVNTLTGGSISGLIDMRDRQLTDIIGQLDVIASALRDQVNAIQNAGSGFPGSNSYTGTRSVSAGDVSEWDGSVRIAVLGSNGQPVPSPYSDEENGLAPLTLDLSLLDSGDGAGKPSVQTIIDAINQYYGVPQNKVELGNLNNIQLVSDSASLPGSPASVSFDFDLSNLSADAANFYVSSVSVKDNLGASMTPVTSTIPSIALASANTYETTSGSSTVTVNTALAHGLANGDIVFLSDPGGDVDGIPQAAMTGYFTVSNVTTTSFEITVASTLAGGTSPTTVAGMTARPPYAQVAPGETARTSPGGLITASLTNNPASTYYDVTVTVGVDDGTGTIKESQITYRVVNQQSNTLNAYYGATAATGDGELIAPSTSLALQPRLTATLVDANGIELPKSGGKYLTTVNGYLKLTATGSGNTVVIDSLDSVEMGSPDTIPRVATGRGFSHYFDLNNFFHSNVPSASGDTVAGSALSMAVERRLITNPSLVATGTLTPTRASLSVGNGPNYTYEINPGDNTIIQRWASLGINTLTFAATGGLGASTQTFSAYAGSIIGTVATNAATAKTNNVNAQTLLDGYTKQASSISGVNLDNELANTVIYQNAYAASARVITVANSLFDTLLKAF